MNRLREKDQALVPAAPKSFQSMKKSPLASILSIVFIDLIGFGMIIPILPLYAQRFQATEWQIGILLASYSFMQFLASPVLGWFSDRYGRKPVCSAVSSDRPPGIS